MNDYDRNGIDDFAQGLDFNRIKSVFDPYKPNAPILALEKDTYYVTIGTLKMPVLFTHGGTGDWKQRYAVRVPLADGSLSQDSYTSPVQYNEATNAYVLYNPNNWYDPTTFAPKYDSTVTAAKIATNAATQSKSCIGCHTTGIRTLAKTASGEWLYRPFPAALYYPEDPSYFDFDGDGNADILNIGCEACHGPGSLHVLGGGNPAKIVHPGKLTPEKQNEICSQCHVRVKSVPAGTHDWPYKEDSKLQYYPGQAEPLSNYYKEAPGLWGDGRNSRQHHQQWEDMAVSGKPSFAFHKVVCTECHNPHRAGTNRHQVVTQIKDGDLTIPTKVSDNTLCLACHATHGPFAAITKAEVAKYAANVNKIAQVTSEHSRHPYGPDRVLGLSRCVECHMPKIAASGAPYDIRSHTFEPIAPEKTIQYQSGGGMPNACAVSCHGTRADAFGLGIDTAPTVWNQPIDVNLSRKLMEWYGPQGIWWNTSKPSSLTNRILQTAPAHPVAFDPDQSID